MSPLIHAEVREEEEKEEEEKKEKEEEEEEEEDALTICPPVCRCCCWSNMAESRDIPLRDQYLLENIIMAGCILGTGTGPSFFTWAEAIGNQWVYEYHGSSLLSAGAAHTERTRLSTCLPVCLSACLPNTGHTSACLPLYTETGERQRERERERAPPSAASSLTVCVCVCVCVCVVVDLSLIWFCLDPLQTQYE